MKANKYTISDVAKMLGVSRSAVSKAMNNAPGVSPEVRKKILDFIEEIGYKPNTLARGLSKGKINIVTLILGDVRNPFYSDLAFYIQKILNENGYMVMVFNSEYKEQKEIEFIKMTEQFNFAGLILITAQSNDLKLALEKVNVPVVLVNRSFEDYQGDAVFLDNFKAGYIATMHLMELGHRRIGFIGGQIASSSIEHRINGYKQVLRNYHLPILDEDTILGELGFETGFEIAEEIIKDIENRPSAFVIGNDMTALGFMDCCKQRGVKIPQVFSIISFDDIMFSSMKDIELTTVSQHVKEMSENTARLMLRRLQEPHATSERLIIDPTLILRSSTEEYNQNRLKDYS